MLRADCPNCADCPFGDAQIRGVDGGEWSAHAPAYGCRHEKKIEGLDSERAAVIAAQVLLDIWPAAQIDVPTVVVEG